MRNIDKLVVHCSATPPQMDIGVKEVRKWHVDGNGWRDIGYHFVIRRDGVIERGRDIGDVGAHTLGHNANSIGICLIGGVSGSGKSEQNYTANQYYSLKKLLDVLFIAFPNSKILGHNNLASTDCPCFDVAAWWSDCFSK